MHKIYKDNVGEWYIVTTAGNIVYLPEPMQNEESVDFINDYFIQIKL